MRGFKGGRLDVFVGADGAGGLDSFAMRRMKRCLLELDLSASGGGSQGALGPRFRAVPIGVGE